MRRFLDGARGGLYMQPNVQTDHFEITVEAVARVIDVRSLSK
jgi:hypothetical protein